MSLFVAGFLILVLIAAFVSLRPRSTNTALCMESFDIFALAARYRPMMRLLDGSDFEIVNSIGDPRLTRRVKRQRRAIFRGYLRCLSRDHARLCAHIRAAALESPVDCSPLLLEVYRAEMRFRMTMAAVNFRLVLHAVGLPNVAASGLMYSFEVLRQRAELTVAEPNPGARSLA